MRFISRDDLIRPGHYVNILIKFSLVILSSAQPCSCHLNFSNKTCSSAGSLKISNHTIFLDLPLVEGWHLAHTHITENRTWSVTWRLKRCVTFHFLGFAFCLYEYFVRSLYGAVLWGVWITWENSRNFAKPPLFSTRNDVWETSAQFPYRWRVTTQMWVVLLIGWSKFSAQQI